MNRASVVAPFVPLVVALIAGCGGVRERLPADPPPPAVASAPHVPALPAGESVVFFDDFRTSGTSKWESMVGDWGLTDVGGPATGLSSMLDGYALTYAGNPNRGDYAVKARLTFSDDRKGPVGVVGRGDSDHYYFELVLGRDDRGHKTWSLRERLGHRWNTLASGPYEYQLGQRLVLRLGLHGAQLTAEVSEDEGGSFLSSGRRRWIRRAGASAASASSPTAARPASTTSR